MKALYCGFFCLLALLLACVPFGAGLAETYISGYPSGFFMEYDPDCFEVEDDFMESLHVRFTYTGDADYPIYMDIQCIEGDRLEVGLELSARFETEEHDTLIGRNYYEAMTFSVPDETGETPENSLYFVVPFSNGAFLIDWHGYLGQPAVANEQMSALMDSFELGGD